MAHDTDERPIPEYPGYFATAEGQICSRYRGRRLLKAWVNKDGYLAVSVYRSDGRRTTLGVHQLVLRAFGGMPVPPRDQARHLNGNCLDNTATNLAWGTVAENAADTARHGKANWLRLGMDRPNTKLTDEEAMEISERAILGEPTASLAAEFGITTRHVRSLRSRTARTHLWDKSLTG